MALNVFSIENSSRNGPEFVPVLWQALYRGSLPWHQDLRDELGILQGKQDQDKGSVINYGDGLQNGKIARPKLFAPHTSQDRVQFVVFKGMETFSIVTPLQHG